MAELPLIHFLIFGSRRNFRRYVFYLLASSGGSADMFFLFWLSAEFSPADILSFISKFYNALNFFHATGVEFEKIM